ncbi:hypothetical protein RHMOL_Rhmol10G0064100 [Rhododendron molle]|uniref:Uncharacterized protein n=2 Tax=Rhododendron molle TaxID=49168 RepID=A0ACC0M0K5_RHOML|nr:hypothetical protein RHMOL_Rhmol10G0064100 [Rhododendron molle]KAI8534124.1 hypothetical protein RHMOL_Rhmol10G0064100 [Rhododendron molle]
MRCTVLTSAAIAATSAPEPSNTVARSLLSISTIITTTTTPTPPSQPLPHLNKSTASTVTNMPPPCLQYQPRSLTFEEDDILRQLGSGRERFSSGRGGFRSDSFRGRRNFVGGRGYGRSEVGNLGGDFSGRGRGPGGRSGDGNQQGRGRGGRRGVSNWNPISA